MKELTSIQAELLDQYTALTERTGRTPSVTEMAAICGKSRSTVYETLLALERKGRLIRDNGTFVLPERERNENMLMRIPLYRNVESLEKNTPEDSISLPRSLAYEGDDDTFALTCHTDEMVGEGIVPGDTLVFHRNASPGNGMIVLAAIQGEDENPIHVLRRYNGRNGMIELIPENDTIGRITTHECRIIGILALKLRKY